MKKAENLAITTIILFFLSIHIGNWQPLFSWDNPETNGENNKHPEPSVFLDPIEGSLNVENKKAIYDLLMEYKKRG